MKFKNFVGNENIKEQISVLFATSKLPHTIVLEGEEGIGKMTLAREIASALVCRGTAEDKPCYECPQCKKAEKGVHPDIYEYSAPGGAQSFPVAKVREIIKDVYVLPNEADYKIYLLGNAQCMNNSAQNAFLKMLEEPPKYAIFILMVTNKALLLSTVLSRAVVFTLSGVNESVGAAFIVDNFENIDYNNAESALKIYRGNIGKALGALNDEKKLKGAELAGEIATSIMAPNEYELIKTLSKLPRDRKEITAILTTLKTLFCDALMQNKTGECFSGMADTAQKLRAKYSDAVLLKLSNEVDSLIEMVQKNAGHAILITKISSSFRTAIGL